jgi:hypothetical protein
MVWTGWIWLRIGTSGGLCEHFNKMLGSSWISAQLATSQEVLSSVSKLGKGKDKTILVTDHRVPKGSETLRLPHFLNNRLTDGGEFSLARRPSFVPRKIPGTDFCYRLSRHQGLSAAGRIRSIEKKSNDLTGNRTHYLPACSTLHQPTTLTCALYLLLKRTYEWRELSSRMWLRIVWQKFTNVSEERSVSIFRVEYQTVKASRVLVRLTFRPWIWRQFVPLKTL